MISLIMTRRGNRLKREKPTLYLGVWCLTASMGVSKTLGLGSNPRAPAQKSLSEAGPATHAKTEKPK